MSDICFHQITRTSEEIRSLELRISAEAKKSVIVRRPREMPGIGPICAMALEAFPMGAVC